LAYGLAELDGVVLDPDSVETNIVVFDVPDAAAFCAGLEREGVLMSSIGTGRVRAVTHLDVDRDDVERAVAAARSALGSGRSVTAQ
jgi:threonine aldolase